MNIHYRKYVSQTYTQKGAFLAAKILQRSHPQTEDGASEGNPPVRPHVLEKPARLPWFQNQ
jgi:hypothetical protein